MERYRNSRSWRPLGSTLTRFGVTSAGDAVDALTITGHGLSATVLTYGAILQSVRLEGVPHSLTLGSETLADYEGPMAFFGGIVGPVANRLGGAKDTIAGELHHFDANQDGQHCLHGGSAGTHDKHWAVDDVTPSKVTLSQAMPDGAGGFPADRTITARFEILAGPALRLTLTTTTDAPSIANATNHSYWNLDGSDHMRDHTVQILADHYLPIDAQGIPSGEIAPIHATPYDYRTPRGLVPNDPPLDTTFCVADARRSLTDCLWLRGADGVTMTVATTEAGLHIYDARGAQRPARPCYEGLAIEAQGWPDAPNHTSFPSIAVTPDGPVIQVTEWRFSRD